ncbi:uncharacterized protein isoform X2 [Choristoneura fumiferana]|uniref:uncharacterized protein isoform X2 n=1 Tax=Choristoneura fumiferana TaxID=7141 RepID=UPI003D158D0D
MATTPVLILLTIVTKIYAISLRDQLNHIDEVQRSSQLQFGNMPSRRVFQFNPYEGGTVLGVPSRASHLPAAEPILPGHTLLRPALGMLKSAIKFPHRENENGEGVYGHIDNLGIRYDGKNERVLYSGFRRMLINDKMVDHKERTYSTSRHPKIIYILITGAAKTIRSTSLNLACCALWLAGYPRFWTLELPSRTTAEQHRTCLITKLYPWALLNIQNFYHQ